MSESIERALRERERERLMEASETNEPKTNGDTSEKSASNGDTSGEGTSFSVSSSFVTTEVNRASSRMFVVDADLNPTVLEPENASAALLGTNRETDREPNICPPTGSMRIPSSANDKALVRNDSVLPYKLMTGTSPDDSKVVAEAKEEAKVTFEHVDSVDQEVDAVQKLVTEMGAQNIKETENFDGYVSSDSEDDMDDVIDDGTVTHCFCFKSTCCLCCKNVGCCTFFAQRPLAVILFVVGVVLATTGVLLEFLFLDYFEPSRRQYISGLAFTLIFLGCGIFTYLPAHGIVQTTEWVLSRLLRSVTRKHEKKRYYYELSIYFVSGLSTQLALVIWGLLTMMFWAIALIPYSQLNSAASNVLFKFTGSAVIIFFALMCARLTSMYVVQDFNVRGYRDRVAKTLTYEHLLCGLIGNERSQFMNIFSNFSEVLDGGDINPELWQTVSRYIDSHHVSGIPVYSGKFKPAQAGREPTFGKQCGPVAKALFNKLYAQAINLRRLNSGVGKNDSNGDVVALQGIETGLTDNSETNQQHQKSSYDAANRFKGMFAPSGVFAPSAKTKSSMFNESGAPSLPRATPSLISSNSASHDHDRRVIYREELIEIAKGAGLSPQMKAFERLIDEYLDPDKSGYTRPSRLRRTVDFLTQDRYRIAVTMQDAQTVTKSMESLFIIIYLLIAALVIFGIYSTGKNITDSLTAIASLVVAWSFVFGPSMRNSFESLIFLFSVHLYDVGDLVNFDNQLYKVARIRVIMTDFVRDDGHFVRIENVALRTKTIINLTTSKNYAQLINFYVNASEMTPEILRGLTADITTFVNANQNDYGEFHVTMREFVHSVKEGGNGDTGNFVRMAVWLNFKKMCYELKPCHLARQAFIMHVCELLKKYDIGQATKLHKLKKEITLLDAKVAHLTVVDAHTDSGQD